MVTAPWLKAMFSHKQIATEFAKSYKDTISLFNPKVSGVEVFNAELAPEDVRSALIKAENEGDLFPLVTQDIMAIANRNTAHLRGLDKYARHTMDGVALTFSVPERINRISTFITAYRLAKDPKNRKSILGFIRKDKLGRAQVSNKTGEEFAFAFAEYAVSSLNYIWVS